MLIRVETPEDIQAIREVTRTAFAPMPFSDQSEAAIIDNLRAAGALTLSLVAEEGGQIIGHAAFSRVNIWGSTGGWFCLGPVAVQPARQKAGVGVALISDGLQRLIALNASGCVVVGSPDYYGRFRFQSDPHLRYDGTDTQFVQRLVFTGPDPKGNIEYHLAFGGK